MKPSSLRERPVWRSLRSAFASIWRIRSRVTANSLPTSSRVQSVFCPTPKRIRRICSSRGVSVAKTLRVSSPRLLLIADGSFERNRLLDELDHLLDLVERHLHLLGDLFRTRLAAQARHQQAP